MAILRDIFRGDDEPAWELDELDLDPQIAEERELDELEGEARDWLASQEDGDDGE